MLSLNHNFKRDFVSKSAFRGAWAARSDRPAGPECDSRRGNARFAQLEHGPRHGRPVVRRLHHDRPQDFARLEYQTEWKKRDLLFFRIVNLSNVIPMV